MKRTYQENKSLYESIMRDVAKTVKRHLNEENGKPEPFDNFENFMKDFDHNHNEKEVIFGQSFSIKDLKNPSKQMDIYNVLRDLYPERKISFKYSPGKFGFGGIIRDENTKEVKMVPFVFKTIFQAALYSTAIIHACIMYNNPKHTILFEVSSSFDKIRKAIMSALSDKDYNAFDTVSDKMKDYLEQKLPQATTFEERVEVIKSLVIQ